MRMGEIISCRQHIDCPTCDWCGAPMWLATIEPHEADHDRRRFECPACRNVVTAVVKYE